MSRAFWSRVASASERAARQGLGLARLVEQGPRLRAVERVGLAQRIGELGGLEARLAVEPGERRTRHHAQGDGTLAGGEPQVERQYGGLGQGAHDRRRRVGDGGRVDGGAVGDRHGEDQRAGAVERVDRSALARGERTVQRDEGRLERNARILQHGNAEIRRRLIAGQALTEYQSLLQLGVVNQRHGVPDLPAGLVGLAGQELGLDQRAPGEAAQRLVPGAGGKRRHVRGETELDQALHPHAEQVGSIALGRPGGAQQQAALQIGDGERAGPGRKARHQHVDQARIAAIPEIEAEAALGDVERAGRARVDRLQGLDLEAVRRSRGRAGGRLRAARRGLALAVVERDDAERLGIVGLGRRAPCPRQREPCAEQGNGTASSGSYHSESSSRHARSAVGYPMS